ncbi:ABC transporter permease subunit [Chloroflexota bacterium]
MTMNSSGDSGAKPHPRIIRILLILVAITAGLSFIYALQYYAGSPMRLGVVSQVLDLATNPNTPIVAGAIEDGSIRLWDTSKDWELKAIDAHDGPASGVIFSPDGRTLISVGHDGAVKIIDLSSGQVIHDINASNLPINDADLSANGSVLTTIGDDEIVRVIDITSGQITQMIGPVSGAARAVAVNASGTQVAASVGADIQIWDTRDGAELQKLTGSWEDQAAQEDWLGHDEDITALVFSPDDTLLVSGSDDTSINFWDLETGEVKWTGENHFASITKLVFTPDGGSVLSSSADYKSRIFRVPGGKSSDTFVGHLSSVNAIALGVLPETLITGGADGSIRQWDIANTSVSHIEWTKLGVQSVWGSLLSAWLLICGVIGAVCLWGLNQRKGWSHLLSLGLFIIGPVIAFGLPLLEATSYPLPWTLRLVVMAPLLLLTAWYAMLIFILTREPVVAYYDAPGTLELSKQLMINQRTQTIRSSLFVGAVWIFLVVALYSILRRFNLDIPFMQHFLPFIMAGSGLTLFVSAISIVGAVILALLGALGRLSKNPIANGISGFYISLIRGTPLLVQVYIWYLGLPRLDIILSAIPAGILALSVNYGAYMTEIFRAGIQAIGKGQHEAAHALGMSRSQTLRRIVLPQAFRIVIPPIGNEFIAMMKDSSLVSLMGVWELTFRAGKIGRQYFRNIETFIIAAAFYWILTVVFQFLQGNLEAYMARGERR